MNDQIRREDQAILEELKDGVQRQQYLASILAQSERSNRVRQRRARPIEPTLMNYIRFQASESFAWFVIKSLPGYVRGLVESFWVTMDRWTRELVNGTARFVQGLSAWEFRTLIGALVLLALALCLLLGQGVASAQESGPVEVRVRMTQNGRQVDPAAHVPLGRMVLHEVTFSVRNNTDALYNWECHVPDHFEPMSVLLTWPEVASADFWKWIFEPKPRLTMLFRAYEYEPYDGKPKTGEIRCTPFFWDGVNGAYPGPSVAATYSFGHIGTHFTYLPAIGMNEDEVQQYGQ